METDIAISGTLSDILKRISLYPFLKERQAFLVLDETNSKFFAIVVSGRWPAGFRDATHEDISMLHPTSLYVFWDPHAHAQDQNGSEPRCKCKWLHTMTIYDDIVFLCSCIVLLCIGVLYCVVFFVNVQCIFEPTITNMYMF